MKRLFLFALSVAFLTIVACSQGSSSQDSSQEYIHLQGETMGTYYKVTYKDKQGRDFQSSLDSLLAVINGEVSTYIPTSTISQFNQAAAEYSLEGPQTHFVANFVHAREIYEITDGAFDPTVMPLVNYWGFGYTPKRPVTKVDSLTVDSLLGFVGMAAVTGLERPDERTLRKLNQGVQLDFSAIAKGYAVDHLGIWLWDQGVRDILVDIGGEARGWGKSTRGDAWRLGINVPEEEASLNAIYSMISLPDKAMATSGNYRNLYDVDGVKYSHTIHPKTGYPERNTLLSATLITTDCMTADALATACMVMGVEGARDLILNLPGVEGLLIFSATDGSMQSWASPGIAPLLVRTQ